jgi:hypothetical protein
MPLKNLRGQRSNIFYFLHGKKQANKLNLTKKRKDFEELLEGENHLLESVFQFLCK